MHSLHCLLTTEDTIWPARQIRWTTDSRWEIRVLRLQTAARDIRCVDMPTAKFAVVYPDARMAVNSEQLYKDAMVGIQLATF